MSNDALKEIEGADMAQNRLLLSELNWMALNNALLLGERIDLNPDEQTRLELVRRLKTLLERLG